MKLRHFVSTSAVILLGWLAVTFIYDVPSQRYPKRDKYPATTEAEPASPSGQSSTTAAAEDFHVSLSH